MIYGQVPASAQSTGDKKLDDLLESTRKKDVPVAVDKDADQRVGLRTDAPSSKDLPDLELSKKTKDKLPEIPDPKASTLCSWRDADCKAKKKEPQKISLIVPSSEPTQLENMVPKRQDFLGSIRNRVSESLRGLFNLKTTSTVSSFRGNFSSTNNTIISATTNYALPPPPPAPTSIAMARIDPRNRIGGLGEDLYSGNYHWSMPLVSLPGRGGMDLNISLHYNSLVWLRYQNVMTFDWSYTAPGMTAGLRIDLPQLDTTQYVNSQTGTNYFIVTLPSGWQVEMALIGTGQYLATDGSGLYLSYSSGNFTATLYTTDGTQYIFTLFSGYLFRCSKIKDRNGNFIDIAYKPLTYYGVVIDTITDTLGRQIKFNYDANNHIQTITQVWNGVTHVHASFDYAPVTINTNFSDNGTPLTVDGPTSGTQISVVSRVITDEGIRTVFVYNSWGQASDVWTYGAEDNQRASMIHNFLTAATPQSDCPWYYNRGDWANEWIGGWAVTSYSFSPGGALAEATVPDGTQRILQYNRWNAGLDDWW